MLSCGEGGMFVSFGYLSVFDSEFCRFVCGCLSLLCASLALMGLCRSSLVPGWVNVLSICP